MQVIFRNTCVISYGICRCQAAADSSSLPLAGEKPKYPVCFLTNGGGVTEQQKAEQLSGWLDVAVGVDQASHQTLSHGSNPVTEQQTDACLHVNQHHDAASFLIFKAICLATHCTQLACMPMLLCTM